MPIFRLFMVVIATATSSFAQTAQLTGLVTDPTGAAVSQANVLVSNASVGFQRTVVSSSDGIYTVPFLPPGSYSVSAEHTGFRKLTRTDVVLTVGQTARLDLALQLGAVNEAVTVSGEASIVQSENASVGTTINRQFIETMPLSGRSFNALIQLTPGVVLAQADSNALWGQFSVNGQRQNANYYTLDGVSANFNSTTSTGPYGSSAGLYPGFDATGGTIGLVSIDALQEFRIQTSSYAPEFGRMPGAQISLSTRSGSNTFHGNLYEYLRNEKLDATDWFVNARRQKKPALRQNNFGGTFSGPIRKDSTFFFLSYESLLARQPQSAVVEVPTLETRALANPALRPYLEVFPIPNGAPLSPTTAEFSASYTDPITVHSGSVKIDQRLGSKMTLFGRYSISPSDLARRETTSLISVRTNQLNSTTATVGLTTVHSPTINSDVRFNWSRSEGFGRFYTTSFGGGGPVPDGFLNPAYKRNYVYFNFGPATYSDTYSADNVQRQINVVDHIAISHGTHQFKVGVDYRYLYPTSAGWDFFRSVQFNKEDVEALRTGIPAYFSVERGTTRETEFHNLSLYAQDTWKASPRLTLTYGLRWEFNPPQAARDGKHPVALVSGRGPEEMVPAPFGTPFHRTTYNSFGPRIGIAWQLGASSKTVLRAGFGVFHDLTAGSSGVSFLAWGPPYGASVQLTGAPFPSHDPRANTPPEPKLTPPYSYIYTADPDLSPPYTLQWNVAVEREIGASQAVTASYVAAAGRRLLIQDTLAAPNEYFDYLYLTRNGGYSDYHSLQLQYRRRLSAGLQGMVNHTWSHSIDTGSIDTEFGASPLLLDIGSKKGPSSFDVRHSFSAALSYEVPRPRSSGLVSQLTRNWGIDLLYRARTGFPVEAYESRQVGSRFFSLRPDLITSVPLILDDPNAAGGWRYNRAAFVTPSEPRQGNLGRNALRGFGLWQADLSLRRQFRISERTTLQFRADAFNVFNHPNFGSPQSYLQSALFGTSQSMFGGAISGGSAGSYTGGFNPLYQVGGPRSMQLALKVIF